MSLTPGSRLGIFEVIAPIGRGGMGVVYLARDTQLGRNVAVKVLPDGLRADPERVARFEREARLLAALNHPNIATVYGFEQGTPIGPAEAAHHEPVHALVMELVEGQTLADRLAGGRLPLAETLRIARQIADGLEAAHEKGIIHRDLKPANVKVTPEGSAKVLDFGLAKLAGGNGDADLAQASTVTAAGTRAGAILGTARYMSPEQARGQPLDKRTDIWSFGCVLYEMLTGRAAIPGQSASDAIAEILGREPDWNLLPEGTPDQVRTLLQRCLEKDSRQRLRDIGDARIELDTVITRRGPSSMAEKSAGVAGDGAEGRRSRFGRLVSAGAIVAAIGLAVAAAVWLWPRDGASLEPVRMSVPLPQGVSVTRGPGMLLSLALSPDGRTLVVAGTDATGQRLYQRTTDRLEATPLAGTEGGLSPFFSPDGAWIGFFADRRLKRVPAGGGAAVDIAAAPGFPAGASWGPDERIVFASGAISPLRVVSARGGTAEPLTTVAAMGHLYPEILPGGRALLFNEGSWIKALDLVTGRQTALVEGTAPRYVESGHLILSRGTTLLAAPFDPARLELTGPVVPLVEGLAIQRSGIGAPPYIAVSRSGTLAYVPAPRAYALVLVEADGTERVLSEDSLLQNPQFSPDGRRLVVAASRRADETPDLWVHDLETGAAPMRLTFQGGRAPVWTPDGAAVTYSHPVAGERWGIHTAPVDGREDALPIVRLTEFHWLVGWTPNGRTLAYGTMEAAKSDGVSRSSILAFADGESQHVVGPGDTWGGRLSRRDGRWLAYYSLESGYFEVYVTPFPDTGTRWLIGEGTDPAWSPDGSEVYYRSGSRLMAARIDTTAGVRVLSRRVVIEPFSPPLYDDYDIHPDGRTLVIVRPAGDARGREITWVLNWLTELRRLVRQPDIQ